MDINQIRSHLLADFEDFCKNCLQITNKSGGLINFELNRAQRYIYEQLQEQYKRTKKIRKIIVKARQQGCSTLIAAFFYHKIIQSQSTQAFILTNLSSATDHLYNMIKNYHKNSPDFIKPAVAVSNSKELLFESLGSGYKVGTAGGAQVGRGTTIQLLHGSEVAFWNNTSDISSGILQAVADLPETAIILESTANGIGNYFHKTAMLANAGQSEFELVFIPWFWETGYSKQLPDNFVINDEEIEIKNAYKLSDEQIYWRRLKINELAGGLAEFKKEYPATLAEAFESNDDNSFIQSSFVTTARNSNDRIMAVRNEPVVIGVDPAHKGDDATAIVWRAGQKQFKHKLLQGRDTIEVASELIQIIKNDNPAKIFIDTGGIGIGIYDQLSRLYGNTIVAVNFAQRAERNDIYANKRAEMWGRVNDWLKTEQVSIEDSDNLHSDLTSGGFSYDISNRLLLEKKENIKKRLGRSPDLGDALALTFAEIIPNSKLRETQAAVYSNMNSTWDVWS